ncbi:hypothetical protein [Bdellovibrio sp. HCB209]|uniref:hypothetical protein n=1 Tax=Bdellovibrio sp. HCB209 TaxID=3394354 RepID=UPI0039B58D06
MKALIFATLLLVGASAFAAPATPQVGQRVTLHCTFTEPFFDITIVGFDIYEGYTTGIVNQGDAVIYQDPFTSEDGVYRKETTVLAASTNKKNVVVKFDLGEPLGMLALHMDRQEKGSDGMSDEVYDMSVTSIHLNGSRLSNIGGCNFEK